MKRSLAKLKKIERELNELYVELTSFDLTRPSQDPSTKLEILTEMLKPDAENDIVTIRQGEETYQGKLSHRVDDDTGQWFWYPIGEMNFEFVDDDVEWIDPDWRIIQLYPRQEH
jgi:hypothetical protein